jgi:hypothetical protein
MSGQSAQRRVNWLAGTLPGLALLAQAGGPGAPAGPEGAGESAPFPWILITVVALVVVLGVVALLRRLR